MRYCKKIAGQMLMLSLTLASSAETLGAVDDGEDGERLYGEYCSVCHGDQGDGKSRARNTMVPPPRDFTAPSAAVELTRERMILSVAHGRAGTAMAAWQHQLSERQIEAVVDFVRTRFMLPATADADQGRRLYAENCSVCHGDDGTGAVWTARSMSPAPRDFPSEAARRDLTRERMLQSVTFGRADTAMPGFGSQLSDEAVAAVVDYVRAAFIGTTDAGERVDETPAAQVDMDAPFEDGLAGDAARGHAFYLANCATCHGVEGDGKGPRAYFILPKPRNFRHAASRHRFNRPALYEAIAKGRLRTEMPAWEKVLSEQEIADVAEYVLQAFIDTDGAGR